MALDIKLVRLFLTAVAAADSIGATTEFDSHIMAIAVWAGFRHRGFPFTSVGGGPFNLKPGQHTDDTDMMLCLARSVIESGGTFNIDDIAARWVAWMNSGPSDIGTTTRAALLRIRDGEHPFEAGFKTFAARPNAVANGSLMRNGVIAALASETTLETAFEWSVLQSIVTHCHPLCVLACCVQTWLIWELFEERWPFQSAAYDDWLEAFHTAFVEWLVRCPNPAIQKWRKRVELRNCLSDAMNDLISADYSPDSFNPLSESLKGREGHVLLTLRIAVWAVQWALRRASEFKLELPGTYAATAKVFAKRGAYVLGWPAMIGGDSDTYGAVAAPLIVAATGGHIPSSFTENLAVLKESWLFAK